jgi:hypothetical protein
MKAFVASSCAREERDVNRAVCACDQYFRQGAFGLERHASQCGREAAAFGEEGVGAAAREQGEEVVEPGIVHKDVVEQGLVHEDVERDDAVDEEFTEDDDKVQAHAWGAV